MPVKRGKGGRVKRLLKEREPKVIESEKNVLCVRGPRTTTEIVEVMRDIVRAQRCMVVRGMGG